MAHTAPDSSVGHFERVTRALYAIAPHIGNAELRVAQALVTAFLPKDARSCEASSRVIADATGLERKNVRLALANLAAKRLIRVVPGTTMTAARYFFDFLDTVELPELAQMGGVAATPPPYEQVGLFQPQGGVFLTPPESTGVGLLQPQGGVAATPGVGLLRPQGGVAATPPAHKERVPARASIDRLNSDSIIDRVLAARPKNFSKSDLDHARSWMHGYQCKYGRDPDHPGAAYRPHPPDDLICAQLCEALSPIQIELFIMELRSDQPPPEPPHGKYAWYITLALQKRHGVAPPVLKAARVKLRLERYPGKALKGQQQKLPEPEPAVTAVALPPPDPEFAQNLLDSVNAAVRKLG